MQHSTIYYKLLWFVFYLHLEKDLKCCGFMEEMGSFPFLPLTLQLPEVDQMQIFS